MTHIFHLVSFVFIYFSATYMKSLKTQVENSNLIYLYKKCCTPLVQKLSA